MIISSRLSVNATKIISKNKKTTFFKKKFRKAPEKNYLHIAEKFLKRFQKKTSLPDMKLSWQTGQS